MPVIALVLCSLLALLAAPATAGATSFEGQPCDPLAMIARFLVLAGFHTFPVLAAVIIAGRLGEYAFVRPGREMLFSRVDTETKYKAKNAIDVPVYRGGDALVAQVDSALSKAGMSAAALALLGAGVAAAWAVNGYLLGRARTGAGDQAREAPRPAA